LSPSEKNVTSRAFWPILGVIVFILGVIGWFYYVRYGDQERAWRALLINFIFFTPLASGMVVWPALVLISQGKWSRPLNRTAYSGLFFAPISVITIIILWIGQSHWLPFSSNANLPQGFWLNSNFIFIRDIAAILILWILCGIFVKLAPKGAPPKLAGWLCFTYGAVFTLIAFDMVMALDPHWFSTLFGAYFFVTGMYAALIGWTIISIFRGLTTAELRHDLGNLILAVSLLTSYLMFSQLLPIWYENLPQEVRFIIPRLTVSEWRYISAGLLFTIYLGPLILLLTRWSKRSKIFLGFVSLLLLVCLWIERWWLVTPTLGGKLVFGFIEISITVAFLAAFLTGINIFGKKDLVQDTQRKIQ
jgi:hypothetical protein